MCPHALVVGRRQHRADRRSDVAQSVHNLGILDAKTGDPRRAMERFTRALEIWTATVDDDHPSRIATAQALAEASAAQR